MKKTIVTILLFCSFIHFLYSDECTLIKVKEIKNDKTSFYLRKEVNAYDDNSGNSMFFDSEGNLYGYNIDQSRIFRFDEFYDVKKDAYLGFGPYVLDFSPYKHGFMISFFTGAVFYYDYNFTNKFQVHMQNINKVDNPSYKSYYDELSDILFFKGKDNKLCCIEHPSLDENQNQKNYRNAEETRKLLESGEYAPHLSCNDKGALILDGWNGYYWYGEKINRICYQYVDEKRVSVFVPNNTQRFNFSSDDEQVESIAFHPSGDIYVLRMNWQTNTHNLYRIENTWDPQWRKEWYENHETENVSQNILSTNVAVNKEMTCSDNLRLRSEEATSSRVITTMQKGTKVKILKVGKAETIDGISSNWVQVEVLSGAKDKDSKALKAGTIGWCYGGYLE